MPLWRVEVAGVSHRYVEASTSDEATAAVCESLIASLDLSATSASTNVAAAYTAAGPIQRRNLLAAMDGLTSPTSRRNVGQERARITRLLRWTKETEEWQREASSRAPAPPPIDPLILERLIRSAEIAHAERNLSRLHQRGPRPPHHGL